MHEAVAEVVVTPEALAERVAELGAQISRDYAGQEIVLIGVLKGALFFLADLARQITVPVVLDFMAVSSYGSAGASSGVVRILKDLDHQIADRHVVIVEDIVDSGLTLNYLLKHLSAHEPRSLEVCALLAKESRRRVEVPCRYIGFSVADRFVVGYGLDLDDRFRTLPYVGSVNEKTMAHYRDRSGSLL